jgi:hypothetical protein
MFRPGIAGCAMAALALAQGFTFTIGSPVAAQDVRSKTAAFAFRTEGCADPAASQIGGTAEGLVNGMRRSLTLRVAEMSKSGVYAVYQTWPQEGVWVVNLKGTCGAANAGALVPIGAKGFVREASKFFTRPATAAEIEAALKAFPEGGYK